MGNNIDMLSQSLLTLASVHFLSLSQSLLIHYTDFIILSNLAGIFAFND